MLCAAVHEATSSMTELTALEDYAIRCPQKSLDLTDPADRLLRDFTVSGLRGLQTIVDIGCGEGFLTSEFERWVGLIVGVDLSLTRCKKAKAKLKGDIIRADGRALPLADASVDGVICHQVIEHVREDRSVVAEIWRILKENGKMIISTVRRSGIRVSKRIDPAHVKEYSYSEVRGLLNTKGFEEFAFQGLGIDLVDPYLDFRIRKFFRSFSCESVFLRSLDPIYRHLGRMKLPIWRVLAFKAQKRPVGNGGPA